MMENFTVFTGPQDGRSILPERSPVKKNKAYPYAYPFGGNKKRANVYVSFTIFY